MANTLDEKDKIPDRTIPFLDVRASYDAQKGEFDAAYKRVFERGIFILGPELETFEKEFAGCCQRSFGIGVASGLDALALSLKALGVGPGHEVIVPAHTFIATWLAVEQIGAKPIPAEPGEGDFNITPGSIEGVISPRTRAVIPVHLYGEPAAVAEIDTLCSQFNVALVEDAAQAHGARHRARPIGSFGICSCFSFYPSKNLGAFGDGGCVLTDSTELADRLRHLRNYGAVRRYEHTGLGYNSRLDELQAAWLRVRLARLEEDNAARRSIAAVYAQELAAVGDLVLPSSREENVPVWHLYVIRTRYRDALQSYLARNGCQTLIHYPRPVYRYPVFAKYGPAAESAADRLTRLVLSLPMGPHMRQEDAIRVCEHIRSFFAGKK
jgi:dTDP-3-amino-3,4,6-trideoxy-alpha-D-glucose transaminase